MPTPEKHPSSSSADGDGRGVLLDLDGTLVDSVYQHVLAWYEAFHSHGLHVQAATIHAGIGLGSDRLVPWLVGEVDDPEALSEAHLARFLELAEELTPTPGACELLEDLERRNVPYVIATSSGTRTRQALLSALGREDLQVVDASDVASSKPAPDLLASAAAELSLPPERLSMVGDAPWDARSARRLGMEAIGVRTGGFSEQVLREAGASWVVATPRDLIGTL
jgi:HAD superfamily hydrolase (TIGR01509 family)